jgi:SAM-dependent methyltransferase
MGTLDVAMTDGNRWLQLKGSKPDHSQWYIDRFRTMATEGHDLDGEARFVDAMVERGSRILDAGCGPGRVGAALFARGHEVVGVDIDPELIAAAEADHPGPTWLVADLSELDLTAVGIDEGFDVIVAAGNVMTFLDPATRVSVLSALGRHLRPGGRIVTGFGSDRDYPYLDFFADVAVAGLDVQVRLATWDLRPFNDDASFLVAVLGRTERT